MKFDVTYSRTHFRAEVLEEAIRAFEASLPPDDTPLDLNVLRVSKGTESWQFDTLEEFLAEYRKPHLVASIVLYGATAQRSLHVESYREEARVSIKMETRLKIVQLQSVFDRHVAESRVPEPPPAPKAPPAPPRIFIGHGASSQWRDLKDHLHDSHGYEVKAYEVGARAGHVIRDILEEMMDSSSFALLVHTGEDETADGLLRARQNVIHETGLFQGRLGFGRAIVLLENGTEAYSNLQGVHQIRYAKGNIKETYGEVLATLRREFAD